MSSQRHFPDWLTAYQAFAQDAICPEAFHLWSGIAGLSGVLERRLWIDHGNGLINYPNIFVLLVARPGTGKSVSLNKMSGLLARIRGKGMMPGMGINLLSQQTSEAAFYKVQLEAKRKEFYVANQKLEQMSGFLVAGEAINTFKELPGGGKIDGALRDFFDCPVRWSKALLSGEVLLNNICVSLLAACTFSDLHAIIPHMNLEGGLASRFVYVPEFEEKVRRPAFRSPDTDAELRQMLVDDLQQMFELAGEMKVDPDFHDEWSDRFQASDEMIKAESNTRKQALIKRRHMIIEKLSIIASLSEGNTKRVTRDHYDRATKWYEAQEVFLDQILDYSGVSTSQKDINDTISHFVSKATVTVSELKKELCVRGYDPMLINRTVDFMLANSMLLRDKSTGLVSEGISVNAEPDLEAQLVDSENTEAESLPAQFTQENLN